jgi:hypothetical protein
MVRLRRQVKYLFANLWGMDGASGERAPPPLLLDGGADCGSGAGVTNGAYMLNGRAITVRLWVTSRLDGGLPFNAS